MSDIVVYDEKSEDDCIHDRVYPGQLQNLKIYSNALVVVYLDVLYLTLERLQVSQVRAYSEQKIITCVVSLLLLDAARLMVFILVNRTGKSLLDQVSLPFFSFRLDALK